MRKIKYLIWALTKYFSDKKCPVCSNTDTKIIDSKYLVTKLLECNNCKILFRHPVDDPKFNAKFYQNEYNETKGVTTNLPDDETLYEIIESNFKSTDRSADRIIEIIKLLFPDVEMKSLKMIDYGSSWGYISYQLLRFEIQVESFEISEPRASFGNNKLKLKIKTSENELSGEKDLFFSSHVIEHHPNPTNMILKAKSLLNEKGLFFCYCPNGSEEFYRKDKESFHRAWGLVHPFYLNKNYFANQFKNNPYYIGSKMNPLGIEKMLKNEQYIDDLSSDELIVISRPNIEI